MGLTLEQIKEIGIPERYIYVTRKDIGSYSVLCKDVEQWLKDAKMVVFVGQNGDKLINADKILAVIAKYIVGEFNQFVKWVDYLEFQNCINEIDEDGRRKIYFYMNVPVLIISKLDFYGKFQFDLTSFLLSRYDKLRLTLCSSIISFAYKNFTTVPYIRIDV